MLSCSCARAGAVAVAEYLAENRQMEHIDLRGNDIKTGGLMALALGMRVNRVLNTLDVDREPKREANVEDYALQQRRLLDQIHEYTERCAPLLMQLVLPVWITN